MRPLSKRVCLVLCTLVLLLSVGFGSIRYALADDISIWAAPSPSLAKTVDLSTKPSVSDAGNNIDCSEATYLPSPLSGPVQRCVYNSPLGLMTTNGELVVGQRLINVEGLTRSTGFLQTPDSSIAVMTMSTPQTGEDIGVYRHLTKSALKPVVDEYGMHYETVTSPDAVIRDPVSHQPLDLDTEAMAYSSNGDWMVANLPHVGLLRVNMADLSTQLFAAAAEPSWYLGLANMSLAISDDGRYVAADNDIFGTGSLQMYDLTTCSDQLLVTGNNNHAYCSYTDLWKNISTIQSGLAYPSHIRFATDGVITFNGLYDYASSSNYKAASFRVSAAGAAAHGLGLLGLGDSYISGQGAFTYRPSTDTPNNSCHLSDFAYPFLLGQKHFNSYNSVACSGAVTGNVIGTSDAYRGQVYDRVEESKRDKSPILANFEPGYIYQQEFVSTYRPEAMLLSVGGDDIGFSNIVKACVANQGGGTCYNTYEDRMELIGEIDATYSKLVRTYQTLREQSAGGKLYVVGYPQIAKPGGDCGLNVHLDADELTFASGLIDYLDGIVRQAAGAAGVFYVDTQQAFDGHRLCESGDKAVNGLTEGNDVSFKIKNIRAHVLANESYHPTQLGYKLLAQTIDTKTNGLTAAMPAASGSMRPIFDPTTPLLQNVPMTGRPMRRIKNDDTIVNDIALQGDVQQVTVDGTEMQLQPGSMYQIVLHSDPILLDEGGVDADGNISATVHLPNDVPPGYHTLHVYGKDIAGNDVDIQKVFYIASSNHIAQNACEVVQNSGADTDNDGVDDACDPEITQPAIQSDAVHATVSVSRNSQTNVAATALTNQSHEKSSSKAAILGAATSTAANKRVAAISKYQKLYRLSWEFVGVIGAGLLAVLYAVQLYRLKK